MRLKNLPHLQVLTSPGHQNCNSLHFTDIDRGSQRRMPKIRQPLHCKEGCKCGLAWNMKVDPNPILGTPFFFFPHMLIHLGIPANHHAHSTVTPTHLNTDSPTLHGRNAKLWMECRLLSPIHAPTVCSLRQLLFESLWDSPSHWTKTACASSSQHGIFNNIPRKSAKTLQPRPPRAQG